MGSDLKKLKNSKKIVWDYVFPGLVLNVLFFSKDIFGLLKFFNFFKSDPILLTWGVGGGIKN